MLTEELKNDLIGYTNLLIQINYNTELFNFSNDTKERLRREIKERIEEIESKRVVEEIETF